MTPHHVLFIVALAFASGCSAGYALGCRVTATALANQVARRRDVLLNVIELDKRRARR